MKYRFLDVKCRDEVANLFKSVFTTSEGAQEGRLLGRLVAELSSSIDNEEIIGLGAYEGESIVGAIFFTRLRFDEPASIYMLSPVAVSTGRQGQGIGQNLIGFGLDELRKRSVEVVVTYGDPSYYCRVGFEPLSEDVLQAPQALSMPRGWLGQSLTDESIAARQSRPACVEQFADSVYW